MCYRNYEIKFLNVTTETQPKYTNRKMRSRKLQHKETGIWGEIRDLGGRANEISGPRPSAQADARTSVCASGWLIK